MGVSVTPSGGGRPHTCCLNLLCGVVVLHGRFDFRLDTSVVICGRFSPIAIRIPMCRLVSNGRRSDGHSAGVG